MSNFGNAKILGGIGALLTLIGVFVSTFGAIFIIGLVLLFIAVKFIADESKDKKIFDNFLYFFICHIIAIVSAVAIMAYSFASIDISNIQELAKNITDFSTFWEVFEPVITGCLLSLFIAWILLIIASLYLRKSYNSIAEHTKVKLFKTTGLVYFIGAITLIIGIGAVIILIAIILEIVAFFSIPDQLPVSDALKGNERRCPNCGRVIPEDARACPYCAKKFEDYL